MFHNGFQINRSSRSLLKQVSKSSWRLSKTKVFENKGAPKKDPKITLKRHLKLHKKDLKITSKMTSNKP